MAGETEIYDLKCLFENDKIRTAGTSEEPLFMAADVAERIEDKNYRRWILEHANPEDIVSVKIRDSRGREQNAKFFTEQGCYTYLLQSNLPKAHAFQRFVQKTLTELRKRGKVELLRKVDAESALAKRAKSELARAVFIGERLREEAEFLRNNANREYIKEPDHTPENMAMHYINVYLYEYKWLLPRQSTRVNHNIWRLPRHFGVKDISKEDMKAIFEAAERYFPKNECGKMHEVVINRLNPYRIRRTHSSDEIEFEEQYAHDGKKPDHP
jgi:prophage antirepressor-like protein